MTKKATAKTNAAKTSAPVSPFMEMAYLMGSGGELLYEKTVAHRSPGSHEHVNQAFDVAAYDIQRPAEADPKTWEKIFEVCDNWYLKNGLVRNIIDLMTDFCVAGIQISSPDPEEQAVLRKWFEKVDGEHVSERIANMLYRLGNVGVRRQLAQVKIDLREKWQEIIASKKVEIKIPDYIKDETVLPYKYVTIGPKHIKVPKPEVSAFLTEPYYGLRIKKDLTLINRLDNDIDDDALMKLIPPDIREALTSGKTVRLDIGHIPDLVCGHMTRSWVLTARKRKVILDNRSESELPETIHLACSAVIYRDLGSMYQSEINRLILGIEAGEVAVSMECRFNEFDYALLDESTGTVKIVARNDETAWMSGLLRWFGGDGIYTVKDDNGKVKEYYRVGRALRDITFTGKGFVQNPANPDSIILDKSFEPKTGAADVKKAADSNKLAAGRITVGNIGNTFLNIGA